MSSATLVCALVLLGQSAPGTKLVEGVALYRSGQPGPALAVLLDGLDQPATRHERAQMRLYIGLIQFGYGREGDARASFTRALELEPRLAAPGDAPAGAIALFESVRRELPARGEPRARKKIEKKKLTPEPERGPEVLEPSNPDKATRSEDRDLLDRARERTDDEAGLELPYDAPPEQEEVPVVTWVALGAGSIAFVAGVVLAALAASHGSSALDEPDKATAGRLNERAHTENGAALVAFVGAGALVGVAAVTLSF